MSEGVRTIHQKGSRYYVHPETDDLAPSVTSVLNMEAKPFLQTWSAGMAAEAAVTDLEVVQRIASRDRQAAVDFLKFAAKRYTKVRADVGSLVHDYFELRLRGEEVPYPHHDVEPYVPHIEAWLDRYQPELLHAEDVAWSRSHDYAGSFDFLVRINGKVVLGDLKTSKSVYLSVATQLAAYAHADDLITVDRKIVPFPKVDAGAVLHVTPGRAEFRPVKIDREIFDRFLTLRKRFAEDRASDAGIIGRVAWKHEAGHLTGTARRAS
ncbi:hypothetical protein [Kitasatospora sp. MBT66]|uniref:hypothetical protein n=1 Tax=Kitasatospora sp. MBT66 TaxID=1444769 RepID=UPI0005B84D76|nr:hypothetical protein [Kitasatospora sp. MBT66]